MGQFKINKRVNIRRWLLRTFTTVMVLSVLITADCAYVIQKSKWSSFDKFRLKSYLQLAAIAGRIVPPLGPLDIIHHAALLGHAYINKSLPSVSTMHFFRKTVTQGQPYKKVFSRHRTLAQQHLNQTGTHEYVTCFIIKKNIDIHCDAREPPLQVNFGFGLSDHFNMVMRTQKVKDKLQTGFFVFGLGIVAADNPRHLVRNLPTLNKLAFALNNLLARLETEGMARRYYVNLTESDKTSRFSTATDRLSVKQWLQSET